MAYLLKRVVRGKKRWVIRWQDSRKGKGKAGLREVLCDKKKATNDILRKQLLNQYKQKEKKSKQDVEVYGIVEDPSEKYIVKIVKEYIEGRQAEVELRKTLGGKSGIAENTLKLIEEALTLFVKFTTEKKIKKCKELNAGKIIEYRKWLQTKRGNKVQFRKPHTLNKLQGKLKTFLNSYAFAEPPVFQNVHAMISVLKPFATSQELPFHFSVTQLQTILRSALNLDIEQCTTSREMHDQGKNFDGELPLKNAPLFPVLCLAMLTGCRKSELLSLTWDNIDIEAGVIRVHAQKTGRQRLIPLNDSVHGVISQELVKLLKLWKLKAQTKYVLPHSLSDKPTDSKKALERFKKLVDIPELTYQNMRKNFTSYTVSFGVTPAVCAFWLGHSPAVAEAHYLSYAFDRKQGNSIAEAMGISEILQDAIRGYSGQGEFANLRLTKWSA